jgi:integrase
MLGTSAAWAAQAFDPKAQWHGDVLDLQDRTGPRKPTSGTPSCRDRAAAADPGGLEEGAHIRSVASRKRWWRTAAAGARACRRATAYDIRHTVATMLDNSGVPGVQISGITGHLPRAATSPAPRAKHYLHYDPHNCPQAKRALTKFFKRVMAKRTNGTRTICGPNRNIRSR